MEIHYCEAKQVVEQLTALLGLIATLMILISEFPTSSYTMF